MTNKKKISLIFISTAFVFLFFALEHKGIIRPQINIDRLQKTVNSFGILGKLLYIFICSIRPFLFIPITVLLISGGVIFGVVEGSLYNLIGLMGAASLSFLVARKFQKIFRKIIGEKYVNKFSRYKDEDIIRRLFIMRVTPVFPFDPISYGAGLSQVSYKQFILGTFLGAFPKVALYTFLGDQIENLFSVETLIVYVILIFLALIPYFFKKRDEH